MAKIIKVDFVNGSVQRPARLEPADGWLPIKSVPKDGTDVLLVITFPHVAGMPDEVVRTRWSDPKRDGGHGNRYKGWSGLLHSGTASLWEIESVRGVPVLWMRTPVAPKRQARAGTGR